MKIMVVDDSRTMRRIIARGLESHGCTGVEVVEASDGAEALARLADTSGGIDLVLCDMNMPVVDGLSLLKSMRASPRWRRTPFVLVTADSSDETTRTAVREGAAGVVVKPFDPSVLCRIVKRVRRRGGRSTSGVYRTDMVTQMARALARSRRAAN